MLTAERVIARVDDYKPNGYGTVEKLEVLYGLEKRIEAEIIDTHENPDGVGISLLPDCSDPALPLIAEDHPDMYFYRLLAAVDLHNGDLTRYNNDAALFNEAYDAFRREYNRAYPAKQVKLRY